MKGPGNRSIHKKPLVDVLVPIKQESLPNFSSKREREEYGQSEPSTSSMSPPKRHKQDPEEEMDRKRAEDVAVASTSMEAAFDFLERSANEFAAMSGANGQPADQEPSVESLLAMLNQDTDLAADISASFVVSSTTNEATGTENPQNDDATDTDSHPSAISDGVHPDSSRTQYAIQTSFLVDRAAVLDYWMCLSEVERRFIVGQDEKMVTHKLQKHYEQHGHGCDCSAKA